MPLYHDVFWGYEITYPDFWFHKSSGDTVYFAVSPDCLDPLYDGPDAGFIAIRGEWNWARKDITPIWNENIGKIAGFLGAKDVGSAAWRLGGANGLEAEIVLPKKENRRLWTGILSHDFCVLHFMVSHPKTVRATFEPLATKIISRLNFAEQGTNLDISAEGIPLPPGYQVVDPKTVIDDIDDPSRWFAFDGDAGIGALQSFYVQAFPGNNWEIVEYVPYTPLSNLGFARYKIKKGSLGITLGILPAKAENVESSQNHARIVYKVSGD